MKHGLKTKNIINYFNKLFKRNKINHNLLYPVTKKKNLIQYKNQVDIIIIQNNNKININNNMNLSNLNNTNNQYNNIKCNNNLNNIHNSTNNNSFIHNIINQQINIYFKQYRIFKWNYN